MVIMIENINYTRIEKAIQYLVENFKQQPTLDELAQYIGVSPFHFQRIFTEWAGISQKKFLEHLTIEALKQELQDTSNLIEAAEKVGLSAQSRVYDLFVKIEAVTPQEYKSKGAGIRFEYGFSATPFGECFIVSTSRGICEMQFSDCDRNSLINEIKHGWANAQFLQNDGMAQEIAEKIFSPYAENKSLTLWLKGTPFQIKVWKALLEIPFGSVTSYSQGATNIGDTQSTFAVRRAVANNPVGFVIPCHRVIRNTGIIGDYHWKKERKATIIGWEKAIKNKTINNI